MSIARKQILTHGSVSPSDIVRLVDKRLALTVPAVLAGGVAGLDSRGQYRAIRSARIKGHCLVAS